MLASLTKQSIRLSNKLLLAASLAFICLLFSANVFAANEWSATKPSGSSSQIETKTQYRYADKSTTTSDKASLSGWTQSGSTWKAKGSGFWTYFVRPNGFNSSQFGGYKTYALSSSTASDSKCEVSAAAHHSYIYWHWAAPWSKGAAPYNCYISSTYGDNIYPQGGSAGNATVWEAFESANNCHYQNNGDGTFKVDRSTHSSDYSVNWFKTEVFKQTYTDYSKEYNYYKWSAWSDWQDDVVSSSSTRKVETRTLYRLKTSASSTKNGVCKASDGKWYNYKDGVVVKQETVAQRLSDGTWWYVNKKGQVDQKKTSVVKRADNNTWWYVENGKVQFGVTSVVKRTDNNTWWYVKNGKVQFGVTSIVKRTDNNTWWYVKNGKVQFGVTSVVKRTDNNTWWYVKNGQVQFGTNSIVKRADNNTWWYVRGGKVQFSYNGECNASVNGKKTLYNIKGGKMTGELNSKIIELDNGIYYYDITGDGKADKLVVALTNEDGVRMLYVYVNGKKMIETGGRGVSAVFYRYDSSNEYILVDHYYMGGGNSTHPYYYKNNTLEYCGELPFLRRTNITGTKNDVITYYTSAKQYLNETDSITKVSLKKGTINLVTTDCAITGQKTYTVNEGFYPYKEPRDDSANGSFAAAGKTLTVISAKWVKTGDNWDCFFKVKVNGNTGWLGMSNALWKVYKSY